MPHSITKGARQEHLTLKENTEGKRELAYTIFDIRVDWLVPLGKGNIFVMKR
jgi:hypothetical protein